MSANYIKYLIAERGETVGGLAERFGCLRQELGYCINRDRVYPGLRKKLAKFLGLDEAELFDDDDDNDKAA